MTNLKFDKNLSSDEMIAAVLPTLLDAIKAKAFVGGYEATDAEALGLVVSKHMQWDAEAITQVAAEALIDSNYDALAADFKTSQAYMHLHGSK